MRDVVINKMMLFINDGSYSKIDLEKIKYGLECIYIMITKGFVVFTAAYFLGILKHTLFFMIPYGLIRTTAGGLHASKSWICMISSLLIFIILPFASKILIIPKIVRLIIMFISTILISIFAPADTKKRPIISKVKRQRQKIISVIISILFIIVTFIVKNNFVLNSIMLGLALETIMILPITYKIFKLPYNNYINYLKSHNLEGRI